MTPASGMGSALERMIAAQPDALRRVARLDVADAAARLATAPRIVVVGTGSSYHAARLAATLLSAGGREVRAAESAWFARWDRLDPDTAVVLITHTGETAFAREVRRLTLAAGASLVSVTGPRVDWPEALATPLADEAETYTVSYTAALGVLARLAHAVCGDALPAPDLHRVADHVSYVLADPGIDHVPMPARSLALVGAGPWAVTAAEGALKLREGARMLAEGFDAERLLHGAAVPYGPADGLVLIEPAADPDGLVAAVGEAARREGIPVSTVSEANPERDPVLAQIATTVRLQCLAARVAALRGTDPDVAITGAWDDPELWAIGGPPSGPATS